MKKPGILFVPALICACYLSVELVVLGLDKFYYILAGGGKFATFPDLHTQIVIGLSYIVLQLIYLFWFFSTGHLYQSPRFIDLIKPTLMFLVVAFISYPLGNDIYIYLHSGLMNLSQVNPYLTRAGSFVSELSPFVDWGQTSTYGPASQLFYSISAAALDIHPILAVYIFKVFCLALHVLNGYLVWRLLEPFAERGKITIAYLLHPLLLVEQVGSAHIDIAVSTSLVVLALCLVWQRYWLGFLALWIGLLSKTLPLIWMPLVVLFLLRHRQWRSLRIMAVFSVLLILALSFTAFPTLAAWKSLLNPGVAGQYKASLHELVKFGLDWLRFVHPRSLMLSQQKAMLLQLTSATKLMFVGVYTVFAVKIWRQRHYSELSLIEDLGWVTLILMLLATPWVMPWYASVMLTFAAVLPRSRLLGLTSLAFGLSSSAQYLLHGLEGINCLVAFGLPVLVFVIVSGWLMPRSLPLIEAVSSTAPSSAP
jgi:alpha-1,6-mannosyltransferase